MCFSAQRTARTICRRRRLRRFLSRRKNGINATSMLGRGQGFPLHFQHRGSHVDDMRRESNVEVKMDGCCASRSWDYGVVGIRTDRDEWDYAIGIADSQDRRFGRYDVPALQCRRRHEPWESTGLSSVGSRLHERDPARQTRRYRRRPGPRSSDVRPY